MSRRRLIIYLILFLAVFLLIGVVFIGGRKGGGLTSLEERLKVIRQGSLGVHFVQQSGDSVSVELDNLTGVMPNAFSLKIGYNPADVKITDVFVGDVWSNFNVLQNSIDEKNSMVIFAAGQGFDAKLTGKSTLALLKFQVLNKDAKSTTLNIDKDSNYVVVSDPNLIPITGKSILLNLK